MTTVAYANGVMACDSCWTHGSAVDTLQTKIARLSSGALLGQSGQNDARPLVALLDNVTSAEDMPAYEELAALRIDAAMLLVLPEGQVFRIETSPKDDSEADTGVWQLSRDYAALGSGGDFALAALRCGKSAIEAVEIACEFDVYSRPPIHSMALREE